MAGSESNGHNDSTERMVTALERIEQGLGDLRTEMNVRFEAVAASFAAVDLRFDAVDERFAAVDLRFDAVDERFAAVDRRFAAVDARFDAVDRRFDDMDRRFDAVDRRFDNLIDVTGGVARDHEARIAEVEAKTRTRR